MVVKSSLNIKYLSRSPKHHLIWVIQLFLKNTLDGLFQVACPCSKLGIHPLYENGMNWFNLENYMWLLLCSKCYCILCIQKVSTIEQLLWCLESLAKNSNLALLKYAKTLNITYFCLLRVLLRARNKYVSINPKI